MQDCSTKKNIKHSKVKSEKKGKKKKEYESQGGRSEGIRFGYLWPSSLTTQKREREMGLREL